MGPRKNLLLEHRERGKRLSVNRDRHGLDRVKSRNLLKEEKL